MHFDGKISKEGRDSKLKYTWPLEVDLSSEEKYSLYFNSSVNRAT